MTSVVSDSARWQLERFELVGSGGRPIRGEARVVEGATASVVLLHGFKGFACFSFFPHLAERLADAGLTAVSFNFSGSGIGDDPENVTDAEAFENNSVGRELYDLVIVNAEAARRRWLGERRGLFGHSRAGGIAVLHAARDERTSALATWAGMSTVKRWTAAAAVRCPWLIVHGDSDETVPFAEAERLLEASGGRAELLRIPGGTHVFNVAHGMTQPSPELQIALERSVSFFETTLNAPS